jgi:hypothetical protein
LLLLVLVWVASVAGVLVVVGHGGGRVGFECNARAVVVVVVR